MTNRDELIGRLEIRCFNCFLVMGESKRFAHTCTDMCKQRHEAARALREDQEELELLRTGAVYEKCQELIATLTAHEATIAELRDVVIAAIAYKESLLQTISSRPQGEQGKPMQGRMIMRQAFIAACEKYEGGDA